MHLQSVCIRRCIIALAAFVWLFFAVTSNGLHVKWNSLTGCICTIFPNCVFRRNHVTGYICLLFVFCVSRNASSNCLPGRMKSHSGCILFGFSPLCVFKCTLKLYARTDAKLHWLHLFDFSPMCFQMCFVNCIAEMKYTDWLHLFDFSSLYVFKCLLKSPAW